MRFWPPPGAPGAPGCPSLPGAPGGPGGPGGPTGPTGGPITSDRDSESKEKLFFLKVVESV